MTTFNSENNTWTRYGDPSSDVIPMGSYLGTAILKKLEESDPNRIAEFHHDTNESVTIQEIHERTITVARNLLNLGIGKNDIIGLFSRQNSYTSSIAFGSYLNGSSWCPFDTNQGESCDFR